MNRGAILMAPGHLAIREIDDPKVGSGDCVIRVHVTAVCSTDARHFMGIETRLRLGKPPILGHEIYGRVILGGNTGLAEGTAVAIIGSDFCKVCEWCLRGDFLSCPSFRISAGGYSRIMVIPAEWCTWRVCPLPENADPVSACFLDSASCSLRALRVGRVMKGTRVAVLGNGFMAALTTVNAKHLGARPILVTESLKLTRAMEGLGFHVISLDEEGTKQLKEFACQVLVETGSNFSRESPIMSSIAHAGRIVLMSGRSSLVPDTQTIYARRLTVLSSFHCDLDDRKAGVAALPATALVTQKLSIEYPFDETQAALVGLSSGAHFRCHIRVTDLDQLRRTKESQPTVTSWRMEIAREKI